MAVGVVDGLKIVQIQEDKAAALRLHGLGDGGFAGRAAHDPRGDVDILRRTLGQEGLHYLLQEGGGSLHTRGILLRLVFQDGVKQALVPYFDENTDKFWIKLFAAAVLELAADMLVVAGLSVDAVGAHGVKGVRDGDDARLLTDFLTLEAEGIAVPVPALMVAAGDILGGVDDDAVFKDIPAHGGVRFDDVVLHVCQALGVIQDGVRHADLADVVEHRRVTKIVDALGIPAQGLGNEGGILAHTGGVALGVRVLGVDGVGKGLDGLEGHLLDSAASGLGDGGLLLNLKIQPLGILVFQQDAPVVLDHGDGGKARH